MEDSNLSLDCIWISNYSTCYSSHRDQFVRSLVLTPAGGGGGGGGGGFTNKFECIQ